MSDGIGCECAAHYEGECCCDVDWTPQETIDLCAEVAELKATLEAERVGSSMQFDHINALKAKLEVARASSCRHKGAIMNDRELLELAAKAAGITELRNYFYDDCTGMCRYEISRPGGYYEWIYWNPLTDDGDALRLAVKLRIIVTFSSAAGYPCVIGCQRLGPDSVEEEGADPYAATRRAIVRAAAEIWRMK